MKIIDLYNKIANGEELPFKIKYRGKTFVLNEKAFTTRELYRSDDTKYIYLGLDIISMLNNEVEIVSEYTLKQLSVLQYSDLFNMSKEELINIIDYLDRKGE